MAKPIVAIIGRPNVGKSTLFNRIAGRRISIVEDHPGVTRDRIYSDAEWCGKNFTLVDTGGIEKTEGESILQLMRKQAEIAINEAEVIIFLTDAKDGLTDSDKEIGSILRRANKPVILAVNKVENKNDEYNVYDFFSLGLGDPVSISAEHGLGIGDLLDAVIAHFPQDGEEEYDENVIKVAIIGRPNVGKSSLVNALLGEERVIVSDLPGTTRDAIDSLVEKNGQSFVFIDTAGLRRKSRIDFSVERYSVLRALRAIDRCDVVLMVINAEEGVTAQDKRIAGYADEAGRGCIIVVNKWDLVQKDNNTFNEYTKMIRQELDFLNYAPVIFVSAKTKQRVDRIYDMVVNVAEEHAKRISTGALNDLIEEAIMLHTPPADKGRQLKIYYSTQAGVKPPTFVFFVNDPDLMHFSYLRYLENNLRQAYGFKGTPLRLMVKKRSR